jgi:hypothetical protein
VYGEDDVPMDLEQEIARFAQDGVPRGAPLPVFHSALTNVFGPEGHFLELFFGHVAEHTPVLGEGEIPDGVGWINQVLYQLTWPQYAETRLALIWQVLKPITTLLENYGLTLMDRMPKQRLESEVTMLAELARIFPGILPISQAASHLNSGDLRLMNLLWLTWPNYDLYGPEEPRIGRAYDNSWMRYLELLSRTINKVERPETAILFTNLFYRTGVVALEDYFISKLAAIQDEDAPPSFRRLGELISAEIGAYREKVLENLKAAQHPNALVHVARATQVYEARLKDAIKAIGNIPKYQKGADEGLVSLLLEGNPELDPIDFNLMLIRSACGNIANLSRKGKFNGDTVSLLQGINRLGRRASFLYYADFFRWEGDTLRVVQQAINEGAAEDDIFKRAGEINLSKARKQPYTVLPPESRALKSNRSWREIANLVPPSGKADIEFIAEHPKLRALLTQMSEESGESLPELSLRATSEHALEHMLGSEEYNKLLSDLVGRITDDEFAHDLGWFKEGTRPPIMLEGAIPLSEGGYIVHDHFVGPHASKPCFIVHIQLEAPRRIDLSVFIKLYPSDDQEALQQEFRNSNSFGFHVNTTKKLDHTIFPVGLSNELITTKDGKSYRAFMVPAFEGECAYRRLNGWNGEHREVFSPEQKRAYFCEAMDILGEIHYFGSHMTRFRQVEPAYFSQRVQQIFFGKLSEEIGIRASPTEENAFLEQYRAVEDFLNNLSSEFGSYYKDSSPRNDMITPKGVFPVDYEHNRKVFRGIDLVSMLETGWEYPTDETLLSERREYLSPVEKENLIDRYLVKSATSELLRELAGPEDQSAARDANEAFIRILKAGQARINEPRVYASHPEFSRFVSPEDREKAHRDYWGVARLQRHLEYAGYCARDIRGSHDRGDEKATQVNARRLVYHAEEALDAARRMAEASTEFQEVYGSLQNIVAEHLTLGALREAVARV